MASITFREVEGSSFRYWLLFGGIGLFVLFGFLAYLYMHHHGHVVTGMDNQIVWGLPHVFAVFLIVAASGALNVASIASVFNKPMYKPLAPLSAILALALMLGGLLVLVLDLGRSDRLVVAMTHFNFKSMFTWNVFLYSGFFCAGGCLPVDDAGSQRQELLQGGRYGGVHLASDPDDRYRIPVRLPHRTRTVWHLDARADVHHHVVCLRFGYLPHGARRSLCLDRPCSG